MQLNLDVSGEGPPLIMLHGLFGSLENLGAISRILRERFTLYRIDLRNHGRSPHNAVMDYTTMAEDVVEMMEREQISRAHFFGHSMGGKVAMTVAFTYPQRVNGLVMADIAPVAYPAHHNAILDALKSINPKTLASRTEADGRLQPFVRELAVQQFILKNLVRDDAGKFYWRLNDPSILESYDGLRVAIGDNQVHTGPTLFVHGELSSYVQERNHAEIFQKFPAAKIVTIPGTSHWLHAEQPDLVAQQVLEFLAAVPT